jgi:palmitoyltransferase
MDHHCPWIGTCVGIQNRKAFILFVFYVLMLCLLHISSFLWNGVYCLTAQDSCRLQFNTTYNEVLNYIGLAAAMFFAFFTFVMLADQLNLIRKNTSTID